MKTIKPSTKSFGELGSYEILSILIAYDFSYMLTSAKTYILYISGTKKIMKAISLSVKLSGELDSYQIVLVLIL